MRRVNLMSEMMRAETNPRSKAQARNALGEGGMCACGGVDIDDDGNCLDRREPRLTNGRRGGKANIYERPFSWRSRRPCI